VHAAASTQLVDGVGRRSAAGMAHHLAHHGEQPKLLIDGFEVAHHDSQA
jgi:hypothetical protein